VVEIWRYPVSSVGGERVPDASLTAAGVAGDRQYALMDRASGRPAAPENDARWRKSLQLQARSVAGTCPAESLPVMTFPAGDAYPLNDPALNDVLSDYFGFAVAVGAYANAAIDAGFPAIRNRYRPSALHLLTTASLGHLAALRQGGAIDSRRFRPTVLIETAEAGGFLENAWIGRRLRLGDIAMTGTEPTKRCGITLISQPGIHEDPEILRTILRHNARNFGIHCAIEAAGSIRLGDELFIAAQAQTLSQARA
jgi:uncharacterized protein YcbX